MSNNLNPNRPSGSQLPTTSTDGGTENNPGNGLGGRRPQQGRADGPRAGNADTNPVRQALRSLMQTARELNANFDPLNGIERQMAGLAVTNEAPQNAGQDTDQILSRVNKALIRHEAETHLADPDVTLASKTAFVKKQLADHMISADNKNYIAETYLCLPGIPPADRNEVYVLYLQIPGVKNIQITSS
ncbi:hypothetical protein [Paraburkholderia bonniea]|uniref:hypothetical protein n=1 Tax=Paraburkholderia bonniea TaxID=2152891 RepID=UPI001291A729|nr:hypothetical protein [Paraburkholderia bonniea]